jgi:predicted ArsR family transcriptional regulator
MALDARHIRVRDFILEYQRTHGRKPLWKEMLDELKVSNRTLRKHMTRLERSGELRLEYVAPRAKVVGA